MANTTLFWPIAGLGGGGGGGAPGGAVGSVQWNNAGAFDGFGNWDGSAVLTIPSLTLTANLTLPASSSTTGRIIQGVNTLLHTFSASSNAHNIFLGAQASSSGNFTNTGHSNATLGGSNLTNLTSGSFNIALGNQSGVSMTSGSQNILIGIASGLQLTVENSNAFLGYRSGAVNASYIQCTLLGSNTDTGSDGLTNAIAIGHSAVVTASNTIQLGNASITDVYTKGYNIAPNQNSAGSSGTALTLDLSLQTSHVFTMTGNCILTLSSPVTGGTYQLQVYSGAGGFSLTWPGNTKNPPTNSASASLVDFFAMYYDGTNYWVIPTLGQNA